jgi:TATA-binding protein-associated factor Taf7
MATSKKQKTGLSAAACNKNSTRLTLRIAPQPKKSVLEALDELDEDSGSDDAEENDEDDEGVEEYEGEDENEENKEQNRDHLAPAPLTPVSLKRKRRSKKEIGELPNHGAFPFT